MSVIERCLYYRGHCYGVMVKAPLMVKVLFRTKHVVEMQVVHDEIQCVSVFQKQNPLGSIQRTRNPDDKWK